MKVTWRRHRTPNSISRAYLCEGEKVPLSRIPEMEMSDGSTWTAHDFVAQVKHEGMWAFCETKATPPVVHYWHDGKRPLLRLAFMLGHELGHVSGKHIKGHSVKAQWQEEQRADEYGDVASTVMRHLLRGRKP